MIIAPGATSQSIDIQIVDDTGLPVIGLVAATFPTIKYSLAGANSDATITLSDLAAIGTAYSSGGVKERGEGMYRLDLPNAAIASAGALTIRGEATGKRVICRPITVAYVPSNMLQCNGTTQTARDLGGQLDATISSRLASAGYTAPDNSSITAIKAKTDNLPANPASETNLDVAISTRAAAATALSTTQWTNTRAGLIDNLDAAITTRQATFTTSTGVTLPATVASTTNITAGTITTVTNLTNLPTIPNNWLTATGIAASALNGKGDWSTYAGGDTSGTTTLLTRLSATRAGYLDNLSAGAVALHGTSPTWYSAGGSIPTVSEISAGVWEATTRTLSAGTNIVLAKGTGVTGFTDIDASGVRTAVGLATANLDTQLGDIPTNAEFNARSIVSASYALEASVQGVKTKTDNLPSDPADQSEISGLLATITAYIDTEIAAIKAKTDTIPTNPASVGDIPTVSQIWTTALTEAYRNAGATGTAAQLLYELVAHMGRASVSGTTKTLKKLDGATTAKTFTLDSSTNVTSITE